MAELSEQATVADTDTESKCQPRKRDSYIYKVTK